MKYKTAAILVILPTIWWLILFINQLLTKNYSCTATDSMCNSANTFWGDFTWTYLLWAFSMAFILPIVAVIAVLVKKIRRNNT